MLPILRYTQQDYSQAIYERLGKGKQHAELVYEEFFRKGKIDDSHPVFKQAPQLFKSILECTDFSLLPLMTTRHDGMTGKFLTRVEDKFEVESVMIPMKSGGTLCVSSQVGCRMGCAFCETGRMGLLRNLRAEDIVSQVFLAKHHFSFDVRNVVFMGMGEPFDNYDEVIQAARVLQCPKGFGFGRTHLTISTSGCIEGIYKLIKEKEGPNLAVSVNAPNDAIRRKIMPINQKHDMAALKEAMQDYCNATGREILIAYVLLREINDSVEHAEELASYLQGLKVKINLIPYNPQTRDRFACPFPETVDDFTAILRSRGYYTLLRRTKGQDIMAACGQLGNLELRKRLTSC